MLTVFNNRLKSWFSSGYDAITSTGKRKAASAVLKHEDEHLKARDRKQLVGTGRDLARNYSLVSWCIRKHLDYCTSFNFQMRTEDDVLNQDVEYLMEEWMRPHNCDIASRHPFNRMLRLFESRRVIDGDVFAIKRSNGTLQAIEGDLVQDPDRHMPHGERWFNGIHVNSAGRAIGYGIHRRSESGQYEYIKEVRSRNVIQHGFFDRFDQVRGISPLASAFNTFRDCYEGMDFQLALMKAQSLFAMVITSSAEDGMGVQTNTGSGYDVDLGRGPIKLEMEPGEDAKFLATNSPGADTQSFVNLVIGIALKSLDIPYNMYDEAHTNFFGSRAAWLLYDRSCNSKRADVQEFLRRVTVWQIQLWIQAGLIRLPRGMTINDMPFEWVNRGMPWWDPAKEISADIQAIGSGLDNPYRVCKERGRGEYEDNILQIAKAEQFAKEQGVSVSFGIQPVAPSGSNEPEDEDESDDGEQEENKKEQEDGN